MTTRKIIYAFVMAGLGFTGICSAFAADKPVALSQTQLSACAALLTKMLPAAQQAYKTIPGSGIFNRFCGNFENGGQALIVIPVQQSGHVAVYFAVPATPPSVGPAEGTLTDGVLTWVLNVTVTGGYQAQLTYTLHQVSDGTYRVHFLYHSLAGNGHERESDTNPLGVLP